MLPSMFHRRLLLLMGAAGLAMLPLGGRLTQLSVTRAEQARQEAEERLVRRQWIPTTRGRILDRKGRVLAQDRPGFGVALSYEVISGRWAEAQAKALASRVAASEGGRLDDAARTRVQEVGRSLYQSHQERALDGLAALCEVDRADLDDAMARVRSRIEGMKAHVVEERRKSELAAAEARGDRHTPSLARSIERRIHQPIREELSSHPVLTGLEDRVGFAVRLAADAEDQLDAWDRPEPTLESLDVRLRAMVESALETAPRIPGLSVIESSEREYPFDDVVVAVDRASLPRPLQADGSTSAAEVRVRGVACHVLGWTGASIAKLHVERRERLISSNAEFAQRVSVREEGSRVVDRGSYQGADRAGQAGVEWHMEPWLRGVRGLRTRRLDSGAEESVEPRAGMDVTLTIDAMLQARVQAAMSPELGLARVQPWHRPKDEVANSTMPDGTPLNGAAVVLDVDTGEILAMVSMPTFTREAVDENPGALTTSIDAPFVNRAINKPYAPGSIVKPLVLAGAAAEQELASGEHIACTGHLLPGRTDMLRCWIYKRTGGGMTHNIQLGHDLSPEEAIQVSCNIFFFTMGRRLGPEGVTRTFRSFGVDVPEGPGSGFGLGVGPEFSGSLGALGGPVNQGVSAGDAIQMGIGQGPIAWTPLHAASAYATLARAGAVVPPEIYLVSESIRSTGGGRPRSTGQVAIPSWALGDAMKGLELAVNSDLGTGHHLSLETGEEVIFNLEGVRVWGKTGTAAASKLLAPVEAARNDGSGDPRGDDDPEDPRRVVREGDHSWFVVLAGEAGGRPRYAIAVVMEYSGSGGKVSGPIVNQILHALRAEGYL
ncbi:MAG: penicillin-binding transpeptidase domain-containing protein [Planctomycetota bacterium]|nr:penicillin-binding transpeptidase domain-containing protein [Planctomycetota bacterium]